MKAIGTKNGTKNTSGFSMVEVLISLSVMAIVLMMALTFLSSANRSINSSNDRAFAVQKGISLLEEVRNFTQQVGDFGELDALEDGVVFNNILTIQDVECPSHVASENLTSSLTQSGWRFSRQLNVRPFVHDVWGETLNIRDLRIVSARVFKDEEYGDPMLLADVGTVLRAPGDQAYPTTQTYDVYFLSIENIPGWWVYMSYIKPLVEVTVDDLQARNPGLNFRAHWINKGSYGRDFRYMPFINEEVDSYHDIDWAYFYPGKMPDGSSANEYYVPEQMNARMKTNNDIPTNTYRQKNPYSEQINQLPYSLADEYNHGMRYIDELRYFMLRCEAGYEEAMTPTWRILMEKMCTQPEQFENAILINLHGELLPMPAIRNYSDAARDPSSAYHQGMRAVAHPRYLCTPTSEEMQVRVYAYWDRCDEELGMSDETLDEMTVVIKGVNLAGNVNGEISPALPETLFIERVYGGIDGSRGDAYVDFNRDEYGIDGRAIDPLEPMTPPADPSASEKMWADAWATDVDGDGKTDTVITFYNTPITCQEVDGKGLDPDWRLYGLDYIPSSTEQVGDFSRNLTDNSYNPKNTARWVVTVPCWMYTDASVEDELEEPHDCVADVVNRLTIETRLGSDFEAGMNWIPGSLPETVPDIIHPDYAHPPENCSRTYAWWSDDVEDVPFSDRSQFIGDPRHCPYADLKHTAPILSFPDHYNWWFDNFKKSGEDVFGNWGGSGESGGYSRTRIENDESDDADGWSDYHWRIDVPRYMELLRTALIRTDSVYTTLTGYSYFYMGIGNEIGYDSANGFSQGIPVSCKPFYGTPGQRTEQVMVPWGNPSDASLIGNGMKFVIRDVPALAAGQDYWWGKHWIGELYPDSDWDRGDGTGWKYDGNLPTGSTADTCIRLKRESITKHLPKGTEFTYSRRCMREEGCNSFFLVGNRSNTYYHNYSNSSGTLTIAGDEIAEEYAFPLPTKANINRPFRTGWSGSSSWKSNPDFDFDTDFPHNSMDTIRTFYSHPWSSPYGKGSALVALTDPEGMHTSFQVMNGLSQTIESGSAFIAKWALLSLVHSFLTAGEEETIELAATRIEQLPRIEIKQPTIVSDLSDPEYIDVQWSSNFQRWDDQKYTQFYPDDFTESSWTGHLRYVLLYTRDNGDTWCYMEEDPGEVPVVATPGTIPVGTEEEYLLSDQNLEGDEFFSWAVNESLFPEGSYLIRVEAYRSNKALHYAYHMEKIFIDR